MNADMLLARIDEKACLDDVRFLSNGSSGRMGCALAAAAVACPVAGEVDLALYAELRELVVPVQLEGI